MTVALLTAKTINLREIKLPQVTNRNSSSCDVK